MSVSLAFSVGKEKKYSLSATQVSRDIRTTEIYEDIIPTFYVQLGLAFRVSAK